ncbi:MAG: serine/threonine-protein kinase [Planctomycetia bacterium]|nr:serine/threonine-protein kinase [Planctomycetia bacterium]
MSQPRPLIYDRIEQSGLVPPKVLEEVYQSLYEKLLTRQREMTGSPNAASTPLKNHLDKIGSLSKTVNTDKPDDSKTSGEYAYSFSAPPLPATSNAAETDFELGDIPRDSDSSSFSMELSDESKEIAVFLSGPFEEEMERFLPAELELRGLINRWQVSQLLHARTRFMLGTWRVVDSLGQGGYGHVFLGRPQEDPDNRGAAQSTGNQETDVAIKVLPLHLADETSIYKFLREVEICRGLVHPNVVQFYDNSEDGNVHYAVYEYINGGDLRRLIARHERLDPILAIAIVREVAKGLHYLHSQGIVHRDIKPGNILLSRSGKVKLIDLGLAVPLPRTPDGRPSSLYKRFTQWENDWFRENRAVESVPGDASEPGNRKRRVAGTPDYISPDQIRSPHEPNALWDIYSLGCTFYFMVTGIVPFPAGTPLQKMQAQLYCDPPEPRMFNQELPEEVSKLILQMMSKNASDRVRSANEVLFRLKPWASTGNLIATALAHSTNLNYNREELASSQAEQDRTGSGVGQATGGPGDPSHASGAVPEGSVPAGTDLYAMYQRLAAPPVLTAKPQRPDSKERRKRLQAKWVNSPLALELEIRRLESVTRGLTRFVLFPLIIVAIAVMIYFLFAW